MDEQPSRSIDFAPQAAPLDAFEDDSSDGSDGAAPRDEAHGAEAALLEAQVTALVAGDLVVESVTTPALPQRDGVVVLHGRLLRPSAETFPHWLRALNQRGYTPLLRPDAEQDDPARVRLQIMRGVAKRAPSRTGTHIVLFVLTVLSTLFVGAQYSDAVLTITRLQDLIRPSFLIQGWPFAATLLTILLAHEFGHYFAARFHKVAVTLPYFIPLPVGFGTMGAYIQMREPVRDRRQLFDIGVAGPLAGLVLAVPLLFLGLSTSEVNTIPANVPVQLEGNSIFYWFAKILVFGQALPDMQTGRDVFMNQVTFAAWTGLLVTAINLLPVSQLDGGHTVFAMFGERARTVNLIAVGAMALLGVAGLERVQAIVPWLENVGYVGWLVWLVLIFFIIGPFHPPALDDVTRLDPRRRWVGFLVIVIFVLVFVPVPFRMLIL